MDLYAGPDILVHKSEQDTLMGRGIRDKKQNKTGNKRNVCLIFFGHFHSCCPLKPKGKLHTARPLVITFQHAR